MLLLAACDCVSWKKKCSGQAVVYIIAYPVKLHNELCSRRHSKIFLPTSIIAYDEKMKVCPNSVFQRDVNKKLL